MSLLSVVAYLADAAVLGTYALMVRTGRRRPFHWANALGFPPILGTEVLAHAYPPMVLTVAFGLLGLFGVIRGDE